MVSNSAKTRVRRRLRRKKMGKSNKPLRRKGTPKFPVHPEPEE